jgi:hypothetical protein
LAHSHANVPRGTSRYPPRLRVTPGPHPRLQHRASGFHAGHEALANSQSNVPRGTSGSRRWGTNVPRGTS